MILVLFGQLREPVSWLLSTIALANFRSCFSRGAVEISMVPTFLL